MTFKSIFDPSFEYRNSAATDVRKTFERIRRRMEGSQVPPGKLLLIHGRQAPKRPSPQTAVSTPGMKNR